MTDMTDDQVRALLDGLGSTDEVWAYDPEDSKIRDQTGYEIAWDANPSDGAMIASAPDIARALLDARAELARVKTDAATAMALRVEARENAMQALASMGQAQEAYEAQLEAEAELAAAQQREAGLRAGHESIIANFGDIPGGHMAAVISRAALAPTPTDPGDGWTWNERLGWIGPDGKPADPRRRG